MCSNAKQRKGLTLEIDPLVAAYEKRRKDAGIPADHVHKRAGVPASTAWRWFNEGAAPQLPTLRKLETALAELIKEKTS